MVLSQPQRDRWNFIATITAAIAGLIAAIAIIVAMIWYFASLDDRVKALETQVHTLTVAPTIAAAGQGNAAQVVVPNPLAQACADIARQVAADQSKGNFVQAGQTQLFLDHLGCPAQH